MPPKGSTKAALNESKGLRCCDVSSDGSFLASGNCRFVLVLVLEILLQAATVDVHFRHPLTFWHAGGK
jgi:hypothetical protein